MLAGRVLRDGQSGQLPSFGAERGFSTAELLSTVIVVVAGRGQSGIPRPCQHYRPLRCLRAQPVIGDAAAELRVAEGIRSGGAASGVHAVQRVPARPFYLPVLRRAFSLA